MQLEGKNFYLHEVISDYSQIWVSGLEMKKMKKQNAEITLHLNKGRWEKNTSNHTAHRRIYTLSIKSIKYLQEVLQH